MAAGAGQINISSKRLEARCAELEALAHALEQQVRGLASERDQLRHAVEYLTDALRRRGCCDHDANGGSL